MTSSWVLNHYEYHTSGAGFGQLKTESTKIVESGQETGTLLTVAYEYDLAGKVTKTTYPSGKELNYDYSDGSTVTKITDGADKVLLDYELDDNLRFIKKTKLFDSVSVVSHEYKSEQLGLISGLKLKVDATEEGYISNFDYDKRGLKVKTGQWVASASDFTRDYSYDGLSRLRTSSNGIFDKFLSETVTLNGFETRSSAVVNGQQIIYTEADNRNRWVSYAKGGNTYQITYDERGNVTSDGIYNYKWDFFNRLIQAKKSSNNFEEITTAEKALVTTADGSNTIFTHTLAQADVPNSLELSKNSVVLTAIEKVQGLEVGATDWVDIESVVAGPNIVLTNTLTLQAIRVVIAGAIDTIDQMKVMRSQNTYKDLNATLPDFALVDNKHEVTFFFDSNYPSRAILKHIGGFSGLDDIEKAEIYVPISNSFQEIGFTAGYTTGSTNEEIVIDLFTSQGEAPLKNSRVRFTLKNNGSQFYSAKIYSGTKEISVRYAYDASGRRVLRTYTGGNYDERPGNTRAIYNGVTLIEERTQATNTLVRRFTYGTAINELIQVEEDADTKNPNGNLSDSNDKIFVPVLDDRGTLVGVIDGKSKQLIEKLYYNSTGLVKSYSAIHVNNAPSAEVENLDANDNNIGRSKFITFGWTGMYHEPVTNLYHTLYREYDPMHERWLSEDPAGYADGLNLYGAYMGVNGVDALGLQDKDEYDKAQANEKEDAKKKKRNALILELNRAKNEYKEASLDLKVTNAMIYGWNSTWDSIGNGIGTSFDYCFGEGSAKATRIDIANNLESASEAAGTFDREVATPMMGVPILGQGFKITGEGSYLILRSFAIAIKAERVAEKVYKAEQVVVNTERVLGKIDAVPFADDKGKVLGYIVDGEKLFMMSGGSPFHDIAKIASKYGQFKCVPCAEEILSVANKSGLKAELIFVKSKGSFIELISKGEKFKLSTNGKHFGVKIGDTVYDNVFKNGIKYEDWVKDIVTPGGPEYITGEEALKALNESR